MYNDSSSSSLSFRNSFTRDSRLSQSRQADTRRSQMNESKFGDKTSDSVYLKRNIYQFKVILLGDIAVGKTAVLNRFVDNKFSTEYRCNVSVEFKVKSLLLDEKTGADLKIWDTCGEERFRTITRQYYRDANGVILIFDLTNKSSFDKLSKWIEDINEYGPKDVSVILIGNKSDMTGERCISPGEANAFALRNNIEYIDASAKTGNNVVLLFETLTKMLVKREQDIEQMKKEKARDKNFNKTNQHSKVTLSQSEVFLENNNKKNFLSGCCK